MAGVLTGACALAAPFVAQVPGPAAAVGFMAVGGIAACCLQTLWGVGFAGRPLSFSLYCYPASAIVTAVLVVIALASDGPVAYCVYPVASFLLLLVAFDRVPEVGGEVERAAEQPAVCREPAEPLPLHIVVRLLVSIVIFSFLCRLYDALPAEGAHDPLAFFGGSSLFALVLTGALFLAFAVALGKRYNPLMGYRLALPLMALGMAIVALFFADHWYLSILLIGMGYELFDTLTWILLVDLAQNQKIRLSYCVTFSLGTAATMLGMGVGYFAGGLVGCGIEQGTLQVSSIGIVCVMVLLVTAFLVLPEGAFAQLAGKRFDRSGKRQPDVVPIGGSTLELACRQVADEFHLTPREGEVLLLLARGRTLSILVRDLGIAKGTVQTHMENVYQKLGVHRQQELIDLVETYENTMLHRMQDEGLPVQLR